MDEMEKTESTSDGDLQTANRSSNNQLEEQITENAASHDNKSLSSESVHGNGQASEDQLATRNENQSNVNDESSSSSSSSSSTSSSSNNNNNNNDDDSSEEHDGLSDYEKLRLERIRRNQEYLTRLGLEEEKSKWKPQQQKRVRKKKDQSVQHDGETVQIRKASLRTKKEQVRYSDIPISEILGRKPRAPESKPRKRKEERAPQHRMERYIYREFQRLQGERNMAQKQIEQLIRRTEKEAAFWKKLLDQKENRDRLLQGRRLELEAERAAFGGLTLRQLLQQIDQRFPELVQAANQYDQEVEVRCIECLSVMKFITLF